MTDEYIETVSEYIELYENILGEKFVKADITNIDERIEKMFGISSEQIEHLHMGRKKPQFIILNCGFFFFKNDDNSVIHSSTFIFYEFSN
jgi:hypothetical protein